jgi:pilus assembly protein CpaC
MKLSSRVYSCSIALFWCLAPLACAESNVQDLFVGVNKSNILENATGVKRISITNTELAEAVAVSKTEVLINGKAQGDTSLVLWDCKNQRTMFTVHIVNTDSRPDAVRAELHRELQGQDISFEVSNGAVFLRGLANDDTSAERAVAIASTLGKVVNLLNVKVGEAAPQILLKVRFANVDRTALQQLGLNLSSTGATNTIGSISTGQFGGQPSFDITQNPIRTQLNDLLNVFLFRPDLNLGVAIEALAQKQVVQILAEPNLLTVSGKPASFLAGGEFPFPTLQGGGAGIGQVTIQFREFGVRIHFEPTVTPRGTIRLAVTPEVSSLDYAHGLTVSGYTVPGLDTRRIQTEVELRNGQSFVIAGLLDNRTSENLSKIPGLSSIPLLGKLFESRQIQKTNSELMVLVTPELVQPIPPGAPHPQVVMPFANIKGTAPAAPQNPTLPNASLPVVESVPAAVDTSIGTRSNQAPLNTDATAALLNNLSAIKPILQMTPPPAAPPK